MNLEEKTKLGEFSVQIGSEEIIFNRYPSPSDEEILIVLNFFDERECLLRYTFVNSGYWSDKEHVALVPNKWPPLEDPRIEYLMEVYEYATKLDSEVLGIIARNIGFKEDAGLTAKEGTGLMVLDGKIVDYEDYGNESGAEDAYVSTYDPHSIYEYYEILEDLGLLGSKGDLDEFNETYGQNSEIAYEYWNILYQKYQKKAEEDSYYPIIKDFLEDILKSFKNKTKEMINLFTPSTLHS